MIIITGGAFQGKKEYAKKRFGFSDEDILNGGSCDLDTIFTAKCVTDYQLAVKRLLEENADPEEFTRRLCRENSGAVIIINEIGGGIIPLEKSERVWREETGRAGCIIAENSREVIRFVCGVPMKIKG
ncbi:MAG: bifunctional adenosylcobinamide kinase/adenosylcobinamide-phosphate guanylyltransferase [Oscillospiraceae bacterium]